MTDMTAALAIIGFSVIGNIVYNFLKDRSNGKVTVQMMELLIHTKAVKEKQEVTLTCLDVLKSEAIKQTSLMEQLVRRDS